MLLSLWEIPDAESLVQMEGFHQFWLRQGFPKARALQKAQVEYSGLYLDPVSGPGSCSMARRSEDPIDWPLEGHGEV